MSSEFLYDVEVCNGLAEKFRHQQLHRPMRMGRYDEGDRLTYEMRVSTHTHT